MAPARAVLLLITVVLFAAAWSGDHPVESATAMATPANPPPATSSRDLGPLVRWDHAAPSMELDARFATMETGTGTFSRLLSSLPAGITPGTYLTIHPNGHTERFTVDSEMLHALGHDPDVTPQATLTAHIDGATLVLVRIQSQLVIAEGVTGQRRM